MRSNKYCFDSCMFIEYSKNNVEAVNLWQKLSEQDIEIVINPIIVDEVAYYNAKIWKC